jgi:hypothetical protein
MKTIHLFEEGYYLISNKAVAKSFLFGDKKDSELFKRKVETHLSPISHVLAFGFLHDEFQLLVKLKSRKEFEAYYLEKHGKAETDFIPETTYIFAQSMANLQSGYAKAFNYRYDRDGGLMKGRYFRKLVESEEELEKLISSINGLNEMFKRSAIWTIRRKGGVFSLGNGGWMSSAKYYMGLGLEEVFDGFILKDKIYIRGQFENLPPKRISFKNELEKVKNLVSFIFHLEI